MEIRIRTLIAERHMTMAQLGEKAGVDQTVINTLINRQSATLESLTKYANALCVPVWELLYDCGVSGIGNELPYWANYHPTLRIKDIMLEKHLTSKALSDRTGIQPASLSRMLKSTNLGINSMEAIAKGLEVEIWELFVTRDDMAREIARRKGNVASPSENREGATSLFDFDEPSETESSEAPSASTAANIVTAPEGMTFVPMLPNGMIDLNQLVMIDTPTGKRYVMKIATKMSI